MRYFKITIQERIDCCDCGCELCCSEYENLDEVFVATVDFDEICERANKLEKIWTIKYPHRDIVVDWEEIQPSIITISYLDGTQSMKIVDFESDFNLEEEKYINLIKKWFDDKEAPNKVVVSKERSKWL